MPRPTVPALPQGAHLRALCLGLLTTALVAQTVVAASPSPDPAASSARVAVEDFAFTPSNITITVGGSVVWAVRKDPEQHTVTPTEPDSFVGSGQLFAGDYTVTFARPGRYDYACLLHPFMTGTVIVQAVETVAPTRSAPPAASGSVRASPLVPAPSSSAGPTVATPTDGGGNGVPAALAIAAVVVAVGVGLALVIAATHRRRGPSG